jgi:hypothetical protein
MSNGSGSLANAQAGSGSNPSGNQHGGAVQSCTSGTLTVNVTHEGARRPTDNVRVRIQGPASRPASIPSGGHHTFRNCPAGNYTVIGQLRGWRQRDPDPAPVTVPQGGNGSVTITLFPCRLQRVTPTGSPDPQKVYINQDGRDIAIEANLVTRQAGVTIYFTVDTHSRNRANLPVALQAKVNPVSARTDANGIARTTLTLSRYGGDRFRVSAALEDNQPVGSRGSCVTKWFRVWRKVFCEVDCMHRSGSGTYANMAQTPGMKREYRNYYVQIDDTGADSRPAHLRTVTENEAAAFCQGVRSGTDTPMVHFVLMDSIIWDPANSPHTLTLTRNQGRHNFPAATTTVHLHDTASPNRWLQGNVAVIITKRLPNGSNQTETLNLPNPENHLSMSAVGDNFRFQWDLRNVLGLGSNTNFPASVVRVQMRLTLEVWEEGSGLAAGGASIVGMRFRERNYSGAGLTNRIRKTTIHESGHNMGMASRYTPEGTQPGTYYYNAGPHCHENSDQCVMYGILHPRYRFCDTCGDALRARNLETLPVSGTSAM